MELNFDVRGYLKPYDIVELTLADFEEGFVKSFSPDSSRHQLFDQYKLYLKDLQTVINAPFYQWIDGSYVTTKYNPRDIDIVTMIPHQEFEAKEGILRHKFSGRNARNIYEVDAYLVAEYPENHVKHSFTRSDLLYWYSLFHKTRVNRAKKQYQKGFIQINF